MCRRDESEENQGEMERRGDCLADAVLPNTIVDRRSRISITNTRWKAEGVLWRMVDGRG